jgi:hypothetical protein
MVSILNSFERGNEQWDGAVGDIPGSSKNQMLKYLQGGDGE